MAQKAKSAKQIAQPQLPTTIDELLEVIRIMVAHNIYFTLANPKHTSYIALHIDQHDVKAMVELFPEMFPNLKLSTTKLYGKTIEIRLSDASDKI